MPATFAHPAFAWPLRRARLPWGALCVGSMVPDIAHLLPRHPWTDHTGLSIITFSLPVGLVVYLLFARWVAPGLVAVAPGPWRGPLEDATGRLDFGLGAILAIGLGATSHILVDATTHAGGVVVEALPGLLRVELGTTPLGPLYVYKLLQYGGGLAGTAFLLSRTWAWLRHHQRRPLTLRDAAEPMVAVVVVGALATVQAHRQSWWLPFPTRLQDFLVVGATTALVLFAALAVTVASGVHLVRALRRRGRT